MEAFGTRVEAVAIRLEVIASVGGHHRKKVILLAYAFSYVFLPCLTTTRKEGAPDLTTRSKKLVVAKGIAASNKKLLGAPYLMVSSHAELTEGASLPRDSKSANAERHWEKLCANDQAM